MLKANVHYYLCQISCDKTQNMLKKRKTMKKKALHTLLITETEKTNCKN